MRHAVRFMLGDQLISVSGISPSLSVLDWLRGEARLTGTKEGCNEGDCGACTIVVARPRNGRLDYRAVNVCTLLVGMLDGAQVLTVEHLSEGGALHKVQQAMVDAHGSQCGFCTPGFVMSLFARDKQTKASRTDVAETLAGNLCRCTGYAPIMRAAALSDADETADMWDQRADQTLAALIALKDDTTLCLRDGAASFIAPTSEDELAGLLVQHAGDQGSARPTLIAGNTDVGLWINKKLMELDPIFWLGRIDSLKKITEFADHIEIGAGVTYSEGAAALVRLFPESNALIARIGGVQVRNSGTIVGNIANGSPIGDMSPLLLAAGASITLRRGDQRRRLALKDFFLSYGVQDCAGDEFITHVSVPKPKASARLKAWKISKRSDQDISSVMMAAYLDCEGARIDEIRLAFGGMAGVPCRALGSEALLRGGPWTRATLAAAQAHLRQELQPISDMRASAAYRLDVACNLLERLFIETVEMAPTRLPGGSLSASAP